MSKTTVIYHSADFDGLFCREIAKKFLPDADLIGWNFGDPALKVPPDGLVYVMDLPVDRVFGICHGLPHESAQQMMEQGRLTWIDHHKTSIESHPKDIPGYRIDGVAACRLAWQWFSACERKVKAPCCGYETSPEIPYVIMWNPFNKVLQCHNCGAQVLPALPAFTDRTVSEPLAVRLAGEYDVFDKRDPNAELFQHGLRSQVLSENVWDLMLVPRQHNEDEGTFDVGSIMVFGLLDQGNVLEFARKTEYGEVITQQGFTLKWEGLRFLACCSHELDIRSHLFEAAIRPDHDALLGFTYSGKDWRVSMYGVPGKPDVDVSVIAKKYGGGGHKQSCGFHHNTLPFKLE